MTHGVEVLVSISCGEVVGDTLGYYMETHDVGPWQFLRAVEWETGEEILPPHGSYWPRHVEQGWWHEVPWDLAYPGECEDAGESGVLLDCAEDAVGARPYTRLMVGW